MRHIWYTVNILMFVSCGQPPIDTPPGPQDPKCTYDNAAHNVDDELAPFVRDFYDNAASHGVERCHSLTEAKIKDDAETFHIDGEDEQIVGVCYGYRQLAIRADWWAEATDMSKKVLIYHELGHCVLGLGHADRDAGNIMNPYVLDATFAEEHWDWLTDKLFSKDMSLTE